MRRSPKKQSQARYCQVVDGHRFGKPNQIWNVPHSGRFSLSWPLLSVTCAVGFLICFSPCNGADQQETKPSLPKNLTALAKVILDDDMLNEVLEQARDLLRTGANAGSGYDEVWIRDYATFIELSSEVSSAEELKENLITFFHFQADDGNIIDGFVPKSQANVSYEYRKSLSAPEFLGHKNTVETDQETSLVRAVRIYVDKSGNRSFLEQKVNDLTILQRLESALDYLLQHRYDEKYGLLWGATTVDWGDVQPEHPWGVELDANSHRSIDIYDNAMFLLALQDFQALTAEKRKVVARWNTIEQTFRHNIHRHLWDSSRQKFIPHLYLEGSPFPNDFDENSIYYHGGTAVAIQASLLSRPEIQNALQQMLHNVHAAGAGTLGLTLYPPYPEGLFLNPSMRPYGYQNGGDWTWFGGRMIQGLIENEFILEAYRELRPMLQRVSKNKGFYEWYDIYNHPRGSGEFRGEAGVLGKAILMLQAWAHMQLDQL